MAAAVGVACHQGLEVVYLNHPFTVATEPEPEGASGAVVFLTDTDGRFISAWVSDLTAADGSPVL